MMGKVFCPKDNEDEQDGKRDGKQHPQCRIIENEQKKDGGNAYEECEDSLNDPYDPIVQN